MPRKVRQLVSDLKRAGFYEIDGGKGSHRKFLHENFPGAVTLMARTNRMPSLIKKNKLN